MHSLIGITADRPRSRFRHWALLPLAALTLALTLFGGGGNPASAQQVSRDFTTFATGNANPHMLWSDGTTMYVSDPSADKVFAYNMSDKAHNSGEDFPLDSAQTDNTGLWASDTTMYVADYVDNKLFAYNKSTKAYESGKDIPLDSANTGPRGIWSDGTTMWVADDQDDIIYAYTISTKARDSSKDISMVGDGVQAPMDIWSDGVHMLVSSDTNTTVFSYNMPGAPSYDAAGLEATYTVTNEVGGLWSDGTYLWLADVDESITAYDLSFPDPIDLVVVPGASTMEVSWRAFHRGDRYRVSWQEQIEVNPDNPGDDVADRFDAVVNGLSNNSYTIRGLKSGTEYSVGVQIGGPGLSGTVYGDSASGLFNTDVCRTEATLRSDATYRNSNTWSDDCPAFPRTGAAAHYYTFTLDEQQEVHVAVSSPDTVRVEVGDPNNPETVTQPKFTPLAYLREGSLTSGTPLAQSQNTSHPDVFAVLDPGTYTLEVTNDEPGETGRFSFAIDTRTLSDYTPPTSPTDYSLHADQSDPGGMWSDGVTLWVMNSDGDNTSNSRVFAYRLLDMSRDTGKEFPLAYGSTTRLFPWSVWGHSDGTMYVVDGNNDKVHKYDRFTRRAIPGGAFDLDSDNGRPQGIWSDGTTIWVANDSTQSSNDKLFAYRLSDGTRDSAKDFDTLNAAGNNGPVDIWSDGATMWVVDWQDNRIYAYNLATKARDGGKDISPSSANNSSNGIWSDGYTMWVTDDSGVIFHYDLATGNRISSVPGSCHTVSLGRAGTYTGKWGPGPANTDIRCRGEIVRGHARFYDFHLTSQSRVTITLESDHATPRLFLRAKRHPYWQILAGNPNEDRRLTAHFTGTYSNGDSRISETLPPGSYTIQASAHEAGQRGDFTLKVTGSGIGPVPALPASVLCADTPNQPLSEGTETTGQWGPGCDSGTAYVGHFARFYSFTVPERKSVTVTLKDKDNPNSNFGVVLRRDTVLGRTADGTGNVIRWGSILGSGFPDENATQATLTMDVQRGTYWVEALGSWPSEFTIEYELSNASAASNCYGRRIGEDEWVEGRWFNDCASSDAGKTAAYYDLRVTGSEAKRINIRVWSSGTHPELKLWRASDFTGSGASRTLDRSAAPLASDTVDADGEWNKARLHEDLQGGNYVIEVVASSAPGGDGGFDMGVTTGVEPPDYVPENCGEVKIEVTADHLGNPIGTPLPVPGQTIMIVSTQAVRSAEYTSLPMGDHADDVLYRLGQNYTDLANCTGSFKDGFPVWHFVFDLAQTTNLTVGVGREVDLLSDDILTFPNLTAYNKPTHTLRQIRGERPRYASQPDGPMDRFSYADIDKAPAVDCFTAGETPPCETASGEYEGLVPGTYALTVTMDPPAGDPSRVTEPGPFSVAFTTALGQGFGPEGPGEEEPPTFDLVPYNPPVFSAEADDQTARLYTAFSYTVPDATDPKGGDVTYTAAAFGGGSLPEWLSFDAGTRTFSGTPEIDDYPSTLNIVVTASDDSNSPQTDSTVFTLTVARPAENLPPMFHEGTSATREVEENSPAGTKVGKPITSFDANGDALSYIGFDGADGAAFALGDDGQLTTIDGVDYDYETKDSYQFMVIVGETDTDEGNLTGISVTVNLTDVAEGDAVGDEGEDETDSANTAPVFDANLDTTPSVDENSAAATNVGSTITATDADEDALTYSLTGTDAASFTIGSSTGQIATKTGVTYNYEAKSSYSLTVGVSDGNGGTDSISVTVSLNDVAEAPTVSDTTQFKTHNATVGKAFSLTLPAADAYSGDGGTYSYLLWHKGAGKNFATETINGLSFNATTRVLSGTPAAAGTWELSYVVHDGDSDRDAATDAFRERTKLKIVVAAASDGDTGEQKSEPANRAPSFDSGIVTTLKVDENSGSGVNVGAAITATDPDTGDTLTYSLSGTDAASFTIGSSTGQIATKTGVTYNYESKSSYSLSVSVSDGKLSDSTPVTVSLNDVNEAPAFAGASTTRKIDENSGGSVNVGAAVTASDPDTGATLTYTLSGTDAASFEIGSSTGQITTKTGVIYDYESKSSYSLTVEASDGKLTDSIAVTVSLTGVNEAPAFAASSAARSVAENSAAGTNVGAAVTATDPDDDALTYSLSGTDAASFEIGSSTGQITTVSGVTYDYEAKSSYTLKVTASDGKLTDSIAVTVNLTDVDETTTGGDGGTGDGGSDEPSNQAPAFSEGASASRSVDENSAAATKVGLAITATDPDSGDTLTYSLTGTDAAAFTIGSSTGQITTKSGVAYNYEAKSSYSLSVIVSDGKGGTASIDVTVNLDDLDEAPTVADTTQFKNHAAKVGQAFSLTLPAADANSGDGGPYEYLLWHRGAGKNFIDQAINGLSFNAATRTLSGTPTAAGVWKLSYVVHDKDSERGVEDRFRARTNLQITVAP